MDDRLREEEILESLKDGDEAAMAAIENGISQSQAVEKLLKVEVNEDKIAKAIKKVLSDAGFDSTPFDAILPTREFMLGNTTIFDEYQEYGDIEDAMIISTLHPGFYPYAILLHKFAVFHSIMTRSREGFQQKTMRSYISTSQKTINTPSAKRGGMFVAPSFGNK